jgi:hypothetical protein
MAVVGVGVAVGDVLTIYDHFDGTTIDTTKWTADDGVNVGSSEVNLVTHTGADANLLSTAEWGYGTYDFKLGSTIHVGPTGYWVGDFGIGLGGTGTGYALMQNDSDGKGGTDFLYRFCVNNGTTTSLSAVLPAPEAGDLFQIVTTASSTELLRNGTTIATSTLVMTGARPMIAYSYWGVPATLSFDWVGRGDVAVPEPGTMVLLTSGVIGLLAYAWRKKRT